MDGIPGVTPRCEYGLEILVVLAFLVYLIGISLDKACEVFGFFCQLPLSKSQADALLRQLANHWEEVYDTLCALIAHAAIVYMDETGWKVGEEKCSLWAFASQLHRVFLFGCHKDDATLDAMLAPDVFDGIGVSADAAVYANRFTQAQKCWAHLLRKAIKLVGQRIGTLDVGGGVVHVCVGADQQSSGAKLTKSGARSQSRADQQDGEGSASPQCDCERVAIAACELEKLQLSDGGGRDRPLDERRVESIRRTVAKAAGGGKSESSRSRDRDQRLALK
jgi:Transposase IS66 family